MEPAKSIIGLLGGPSKGASLLGVTTNTVRRWAWPNGVNDGLGGRIPHKYHARIIEALAANGVALSSAAFVDPAFLPKLSASQEAAASEADSSLPAELHANSSEATPVPSPDAPAADGASLAPAAGGTDSVGAEAV